VHLIIVIILIVIYFLYALEIEINGFIINCIAGTWREYRHNPTANLVGSLYNKET